MYRCLCASARVCLAAFVMLVHLWDGDDLYSIYRRLTHSPRGSLRPARSLETQTRTQACTPNPWLDCANWRGYLNSHTHTQKENFQSHKGVSPRGLWVCAHLQPSIWTKKSLSGLRNWFHELEAFYLFGSDAWEVKICSCGITLRSVCGAELTCVSSAWVWVSTFRGNRVGWECLVMVCVLLQQQPGLPLFRCSVSIKERAERLESAGSGTWVYVLSDARVIIRARTLASTTDGQPLILYITWGQMFVCVVISDRSIR